MPDLTSASQITANTAFIDRVHIEIGDWALFGSEDQICDALSQLQHSMVLAPDGTTVQLFRNQIIEATWDVSRLHFKANPRTDSLTQSAALIAGKAKIARWNNSPHARRPGEQARISFDLQLNLTRFVQAQHLKRITRLDRPRRASDFSLVMTPDDRWYDSEIPLRPATNVIIGPNKKYAYALKRSMQRRLEQYLALVCAELCSAMDEAFANTGATVQYLPHFLLKEIEVYWEFDSCAPIDWVLSQRETLAQASGSFGEDTYETTHPSLTVQGQSPCYTLGMTRNIKAKVYAKTTRRVRFEVKLRQQAIYEAAGRRRRTTLTEIAAMAPDIIRAAALRLQPVVHSIIQTPPSQGSFAALELMNQVQKAADDSFTANTIIASLVAFGRIEPYKNDPLRIVINRLKELRIPVLRPRVYRSRVYVVTDEYRDALQSLRQQL